MNSDPEFHRYFSENFIKNRINQFKTEYDHVTAGYAVDRIGVTALEVFTFVFCFNFSSRAILEDRM